MGLPMTGRSGPRPSTVIVESVGAVRNQTRTRVGEYLGPLGRKTQHRLAPGTRVVSAARRSVIVRCPFSPRQRSQRLPERRARSHGSLTHFQSRPSTTLRIAARDLRRNRSCGAIPSRRPPCARTRSKSSPARAPARYLAPTLSSKNARTARHLADTIYRLEAGRRGRRAG